MDKMEQRTTLDILINEFLLSKLNAKQFISNNLSELNQNDKIERIDSLIDYLKSNYQENVLQFFYEEQLINIPINRNHITIGRLSINENFDYIKSLREDAFEARIEELKTLENKVLPECYKIYTSKKIESKELKTYNLKGLSFYDNNSFYDKTESFRGFLVSNKFIKEINLSIFRMFFKNEYKNCDEKIIWIEDEYFLKILMKQSVEQKKFLLPKNNYWKVMENIFIRKDKTLIVGSNLSKNTFEPKSNESKLKFQKLQTYILEKL